jgi:hypothetical protein
MNTVDQIFKKELEWHSVPVNPGLWDRLEEEMSYAPVRKNQYLRAASVAICLSAALSIWYLVTQNQSVPSVEPIATIELTMKKPEISGVQRSSPVFPVNTIQPEPELSQSPIAPQRTVLGKDLVVREQIELVVLAPRTPEYSLIESRISWYDPVKPRRTGYYVATYKATPQSQPDTPEQSFFGKVMARAVDLKNGDLDWSIRDAKQRLFRKVKALN